MSEERSAAHLRVSIKFKAKIKCQSQRIYKVQRRDLLLTSEGQQSEEKKSAAKVRWSIKFRGENCFQAQRILKVQKRDQ